MRASWKARNIRIKLLLLLLLPASLRAIVTVELAAQNAGRI